jgi:outer membrane lipoprotein carrier protein
MFCIFGRLPKGPSVLLKLSNRAAAIFLLAVLCAVSSAAADRAAVDIPALAQVVDNHYNHVRTLQAEFSEIYRGSGTERTESGTLWLKKPGKMRWEYLPPQEKLFVSDGQTAWFYLPQQRQARRSPVKQLDDLRSPLSLLLGKTRLEKELQGLSLASDIPALTPGDVVLRGVPKALADRINEVILELAVDDRIVRIIVIGVDGAETEFRFREQKENVEVSDQQFKFSPPPGVEVMSGELGP